MHNTKDIRIFNCAPGHDVQKIFLNTLYKLGLSKVTPPQSEKAAGWKDKNNSCYTQLIS
jgi:hypothetical protein